MAMATVAAAQAQATRPRNEVSEQESLQLTRNLLRIAVSNISYIRGFFPENYYREKFVPALEMKVNKLLPMDMESKRFIDWIEKGVFDALQKKYLRTLFLTICRGHDGPPIEEYTFSFRYAAEGASENITSMTIESLSGKPVHTDTNNQTSPQQMKQSACKMVRTLVQLMYTLDDVPKERTIAMRLHYYDEVTPENYEPPFFASSTDDDPNPWDHQPLKMKVGRVDGRHYKLAIKVKSVLDPCDDGSDLAENGTCSSDLTLTSDDDSSTSSEAVEVNTPPSQPCSQPSQPCQPIQKVLPQPDTPIQASENKEQVQVSFEETTLADTLTQTQSTAEADNKSDTDKTEHPVFEVESLGRSSRLPRREEITTHIIDITNEFPELLNIEPGCRVIELKEGTRSNDTQQCCELKTRSPLTNAKTKKKSEAEKLSDDRVANDTKQCLYEMALLHTLPREHITMKQLQEALVDVGPANIRKLMSQMHLDGYIETTPKVRCKGRQVFHTPAADKKLQELRASFDSKMRKNENTKKRKCDNMDSSQPWEGIIPRNITCSILPNIKKNEQSKTLDESACGRLQALGSDITRDGLRILQEHSANNMHTKAIPTFQEPPLPRKAMQERAKTSALSEQPNLTPSTWGVERKRVRFQDSDSPEDIDVDCALHHLKARKVDGAIYQSLPVFKRARVRKLPGVVHKGNHSSPEGDDPYHFDGEVPDKLPKRNFWGNSKPYHSLTDSLEERPTTDAYNFNSFCESDERVETLKSREKNDRPSFLQRGAAHKKRLRPTVYIRRTRAA